MNFKLEVIVIESSALFCEFRIPIKSFNPQTQADLAFLGRKDKKTAEKVCAKSACKSV